MLEALGNIKGSGPNYETEFDDTLLASRAHSPTSCSLLSLRPSCAQDSEGHGGSRSSLWRIQECVRALCHVCVLQAPSPHPTSTDLPCGPCRPSLFMRAWPLPKRTSAMVPGSSRRRSMQTIGAVPLALWWCSPAEFRGVGALCR